RPWSRWQRRDELGRRRPSVTKLTHARPTSRQPLRLPLPHPASLPTPPTRSTPHPHILV
ncbi:hypothetical protein HETIRDRAFT_459200, partial [Heterobasidion irregulare TC 32-1]